MKPLSKIIILAISILTISSCSFYKDVTKTIFQKDGKTEIKVKYDDTGKYKAETSFKNGKKSGISKVYFLESDTDKFYLVAKINYKDDKKHGKTYLYNGSDGYHYGTMDYKDGIEISNIVFDREGNQL